MPYFRIEYVVPGTITLYVPDEDVEEIEGMIEALSNGQNPPALERTLRDGLDFSEVSVEDVSMTDNDSASDRELVFDE